MADLLCSATCRIPNRHRDGCQDEACCGCLKGRVADGLRLCRYHADRLEGDALEAADLYDALAQRLIGGAGAGDKVSGTPGARLPDQRAINARSDIYQTLTIIAGVIAAERGFQPPTPSPTAYAEFIATSATWLAAHPKAGEIADALGDLARGKPRSVAYPNGASRRELHKDCPVDGCDGKLLAIMRPGDAVLPPEVFCSAEEPHRWASSEWRQLDRLVARRAA